MILPAYQILPSNIPHAGRGVFLSIPVKAGQILISPDQIAGTQSLHAIRMSANAAELEPSIVRWFEDQFTTSPDWPDECFVNHSFEPTGLWHLGFVFARRDLPAGTEITVDYRHLLPPGEAEKFLDQDTGAQIVGYSWKESLALSTQELVKLTNDLRG
jgi:hypothetical protein